MSRTAFWVAWRTGLRRALVPRALGTVAIAWALAAVAALAEKRWSLSGAAGRALAGQVFGVLLPFALLALSTRILSPTRLETATSALARFGASRRVIASGFITASIGVGAFVAAVAAALTAILGHDPTAPPIAVDALTSAWVGALAASAYAAFFALGSTFGSKGGGRFLSLGLDFVLGSTSGAAALFVPRAHAQNLLGGQPPLLLGQPASAALLAMMAIAYAWAAVARCAP